MDLLVQITYDRLPAEFTRLDVNRSEIENKVAGEMHNFQNNQTFPYSIARGFYITNFQHHVPLSLYVDTID